MFVALMQDVKSYVLAAEWNSAGHVCLRFVFIGRKSSGRQSRSPAAGKADYHCIAQLVRRSKRAHPMRSNS